MNNQRNPIILVHGIFDTAAIFTKMATYLQLLGYPLIRAVNLNSDQGRIPIQGLASQLAEFIDEQVSPNQAIDLIGFSMGGIVSRYYLQRLGGVDRVDKFIAIATPHQGSWIAYGSVRVDAIQLRPGSDLLRDLNNDVEMLNQVNTSCIWTPFDLMIIPAYSCRLAKQCEFQIPVSFHHLMVSDRRVLKTISDILGS